MSDRECNYCQFKRMKKEAKRRGDRIVTFRNDGGWDVFCVPKGKEPDYRQMDVGGTQWSGWMMEIGDSCGC